MKKLAIISIVVLLAVLVSSCMQPTEAIVKTTIVNTVTVVKVVDPITGNEYIIKPGEVGVANADASVNNYFNGLNASWIGMVLNGDDTEHQFNITVTPYSNDNVVAAPTGIADWVTISNNNLVDGVLTVQPMSSASLYTTLNVPSGITLPQTWGFTVNISRVDQGNYAVADAIRWIVHMRQP